ncbi:hypothetical protein DFH07DRAFT_772984 [Mycena maculata]|uniref:Uncharacterized protein n=1 Tax=Mycena maculata TaxID=230809 RepID=A0AAD7J442_9AGAR|nr:hypothetical protein DFH07DRAFT_772984 [Mycena maculata]
MDSYLNKYTLEGRSNNELDEQAVTAPKITCLKPLFNSYHLALVGGLISSSYFACSNISGTAFGVMPATGRGTTNLPVANRLTLWEFSYQVGKLHMASSGAFSCACLAVSAYFTPLPVQRNILVAGAISVFTSTAWTLSFMMPVNNNLIVRLRATKVKPMESKEGARAAGQVACHALPVNRPWHRRVAVRHHCGAC